MALTPGTRLGPYEVTSQIGVGGMGEVYRATDTNLKRAVALKVLPASVAGDAERMARFQREAEVLASLNHPHIAAIYGLERSDGTTALVLELVEGPTLADRIAQGPIPLDEALPVARQMAEALEAAHEQGLIHRDLKPANIKLRPDGTVKVLDFGLAKAMEPAAASSPSMSMSPTITTPAMTQAGMILGTAAYMSPEQARGKAVDKRADIWAFGCVLYEMLAGKRAFDGDDVSDTLAGILRGEPDWHALPTNTPRALHKLLRRCLEKDRKERIPDIAVARFEIKDVLAAPEAETVTATTASPRSRWWRIAAAAAAVLVVAVLVLNFVQLRAPSQQPRTARFQVPLPENTTGPMFHLSPDGRTLAITATEGGRRRLWVRPLDSLDAQALPGTEDATYPFWSPDSAFIGFFAQGKLKKIAIAGGPALTLCDAPNGRGGTWNADGVIVFSSLSLRGLSRVPAAGGVSTPVTKLANLQEVHRFPAFLPGGHRFLFLVSGSTSDVVGGIYAGSMDGTPPVRLLPDQSSAAYVPPDASGKIGHLLFRRDTTVMAQPFDPDRLAISGELFPLAEQVGISQQAGSAAFSVSENGVLAYGSNGLGVEVRELVWMERTGKRLGAIGQPGAVSEAALSPDEKRISFVLTKPGGESDIWLHDVARGVASRFTFRPGASLGSVWSPDGSRIVFRSDASSVYQKPANNTGPEELLFRGDTPTGAVDWSRDGKFLVYQIQSGAAGIDLWLLPLGGDRKPVPYLQTPFNEAAGQFSPDGRWMAYASNESGQPQIYVQPIPASGAKRQISTAGGDQPRWRRDGTELFYVSADQKLMAVPVKTGAAFEIGSPQPLFEIQPVYPPLIGRFAYQPTADGQRFLVTAPVSGAATPPITVVLNWQAGFKK